MSTRKLVFTERIRDDDILEEFFDCVMQAIVDGEDIFITANGREFGAEIIKMEVEE